MIRSSLSLPYRLHTARLGRLPEPHHEAALGGAHEASWQHVVLQEQDGQPGRAERVIRPARAAPRPGGGSAAGRCRASHHLPWRHR